MKPFNILFILFITLVIGTHQPFAQAPSASYSWTDTEGRTLQASFVKLEGTLLTIRMNGQDFPLDLSYFSPQSQNLARQLAAAASQAPTTPTPTPVPVVPTPAAPAKPNLPKILDDDSALDVEHEWRSVDGRTIFAKFSSIDGEDLNVLMSGGRI